MTDFSFVVTGSGRAMVIQRRTIGDGWVKVADARSEHRAKEMSEGLNALKSSQDTLQDVARLARDLQWGSQHPMVALLIDRDILKKEDFLA